MTNKTFPISTDAIVQGVVYLILCAFGAYLAVGARIQASEQKVQTHEIQIQDLQQDRLENKAQYKEILDRLNSIDLKLVEKADKKYLP